MVTLSSHSIYYLKEAFCEWIMDEIGLFYTYIPELVSHNSKCQNTTDLYYDNNDEPQMNGMAL